MSIVKEQLQSITVQVHCIKTVSLFFFCKYTIPGNHKIKHFIQSQNLTQIFLYQPSLEEKNL